MAFIIQKSTELGVNVITPLISKERLLRETDFFNKKIKHWEKIAISACEQCGRNYLPIIRPIMPLEIWCSEKEKGLKINFHTKSSHSLNKLKSSTNKIKFLIGAESGFSEKEIEIINKYGFKNVLLGPRILRTETASIVAATVLQMYFGDLR